MDPNHVHEYSLRYTSIYALIALVAIKFLSTYVKVCRTQRYSLSDDMYEYGQQEECSSRPPSQLSTSLE